MPCSIQIAHKALAEGKSVVIGLQSTGELGLAEEINRVTTRGEEITDFLSAPAATVKKIIYKARQTFRQCVCFLNVLFCSLDCCCRICNSRYALFSIPGLFCCCNCARCLLGSCSLCHRNQNTSKIKNDSHAKTRSETINPSLLQAMEEATPWGS